MVLTIHPHLKPVSTSQAQGMNVIDIPPHDMSSDFIVLSERRRIESELAQRLQVGSGKSLGRPHGVR